ncbi:hypothetical protein I204_03225 [Kwoniella mangroviensis CBS 8886]|nr:hypothetical protein I204_03225 [Kwoniella mangroviensis CBS 8886]
MSGEQPPPAAFRLPTSLPPLPAPTVTYDDLIQGEFKFNVNSRDEQDEYDGADEDRDRSWGPGGSGKKRKVPNMGMGMKRPGTPEDLWNNQSQSQITDGGMNDDDVHHKYIDSTNQSSSSSSAPPLPFIRKKLRLSPARRLIEWKKQLFIKRKSNFISLYIDAQNALAENDRSKNKDTTTSNKNGNLVNTQGSSKSRKTDTQLSTMTGRKSNLPDVSEFEKLLPALEDVNLGSWSPDQHGWKNNQPLQPVKFRTSIKFRKKEWLRSKMKDVKRKGWFPEGSFEFELESKASSTLRAKAREQSALLKLANEFRSLIITSNKISSVVTTTTTSTDDNIKDDDKSPQKTRRKIAGNKDMNASAVGTGNTQINPKEESQPMSQSQSKDSNETKTTATGGGGGGGGGKKKPKKKKRSVLANQSNPHHVDNYRPSRTVSPHGDPYEPYSSHLSLFNPPPMVFLATRTRHKPKALQASNELTVNNDINVDYNPDIRPNEDDFICCFCEYDLYYSTESMRKKAIRKRKKEIKRKEMIKNKAKNVAEGKKSSLRNESDYDSQEEDEEDEEEEDEDGFAEDSDQDNCHDDGHGRCTCGRRVKKPKPDRDKEDG